MQDYKSEVGSLDDILETMIILLIFAFISGLLTIFAPCIWPLLPIVLSATASGGDKKPLGVTLGIILSFALFTLTISYLVKIIPFDPNLLRLIAVVAIAYLGLTLVIPKLSAILESIVSKLSNRLPTPSLLSSDPLTAGQDKQLQASEFKSGFLTGFFLGIVWSPCAGPILATIATLAATRAVSFQVILVTIVYVTGIGIPLFIFATFGRNLLNKTRFLSPYTAKTQQVFGLIMIITALLIFTNYDKIIETKLLDLFPAYSNFLYKLENQKDVQKELNNIKNNQNNPSLNNSNSAPDFTGVSKWLNTEKAITMQDLKGKVVLVDFWTYTCINCIRTLPYLTSWYEKYRDQGFVVIGVHTPEFEFEKKTENVQNAINQYNIQYPVAQDNSYSTWNAYNNLYWPAKYLIDKDGKIRYTHFGEGNYDETEKMIQQLLKEAGQKNIQPGLSNIPDQTPKTQITPETYLGLNRIERFESVQNPKIGEQKYTLPFDTDSDNWALGGVWNLQPGYAEAKANSTLEFNFSANKVFLVISPSSSSDIIKVSLDGKQLNTIQAKQQKLYTLVDLEGTVSAHKLHLDFQTEGTKIYAFTFGD